MPGDVNKKVTSACLLDKILSGIAPLSENVLQYNPKCSRFQMNSNTGSKDQDIMFPSQPGYCDEFRPYLPSYSHCKLNYPNSLAMLTVS